MSAAAKTAAKTVAKTVARPTPARRPAVTAPGHASEREARSAAKTALAGDRLSFALSATTAARAPQLSGTGLPLPFPVLRDAERAFGADLSVVRLHTDDHAARFAADCGALALTAGRDIFFAAGRYDPASAVGRELLFHELAHVLQQTGRRASDGRLAATAAPGDGPLQRQDEPEQSRRPKTEAEIAAADDIERHNIAAELKSVHKKVAVTLAGMGQSVWERATFQSLVDGHRPASGADAFDAFVAALAVDLGFSATPGTSWGATTWPALSADSLSAFRLTKCADYSRDFDAVFGRDGPGYGLLYDVLKKLGAFDAALNVLDVHPRLKTLHFHGAMAEMADTVDADTAADAVLAEGEPTAMVRALGRRVAQVAFVPALGVEPLTAELDGSKVSLGDWIGQQLINCKSDALVLTDNELVFGLYRAIFQADELIETAIGQTFAMAEPPVAGRAGAEARRRLARTLNLVGGVYKQLTADAHGQLAKTALYRVGDAMEGAGERASTYWRKLIELSDLTLAEDPATASDPTAAAVRTSIARQAEIFFKLDTSEQELPEAAAYAARVMGWRRAIGADMGKVDNELSKRRRELDLKSARNGAGLDLSIGDERKMALYGLLMTGLSEWLGDALRRYPAKEDQRASDQLRIEDIRAVHRLRVAQSLGGFARLMGWSDLQQSAERWLMSRDRKTSHIYLLSEWEPSAPGESKLDDMENEVFHVSNWRLTGREFVTAYRIMETSLRAAALDELLVGPSRPGDEDRPLHRQVDRAVADIPMPKRWEVKSYVFALDPSMLSSAKPAPTQSTSGATHAAPSDGEGPLNAIDPDLAPHLTRPLGDILIEHPKTRALFHSLAAGTPDVGLVLPTYEKMRGNLRPFSASGALPVFAWQIPSLDDIAGIARRSDTLNRKVLATLPLPENGHALEYGSEQAERALAELDDRSWLARLIEAFDGMTLEAGDAANAAAQAELDAALGAERSKYRSLLRQAARLERLRLVARNRAAFADTDLPARTLAARNALADLKGFVGDIFPKAQLELDKDQTLTPLGPLADAQQAIATLQLADAIAPGIQNSLRRYDTALIAGYLELLPKVMRVADTTLKSTDETGKTLIAEALSGNETIGEILEARPKLDELMKSLETQRVQNQVQMGFRGEVAQEKSDLDTFKEKHPDLGRAVEDSITARTVARLFGLNKPNPAFINGIKHPIPLPVGEQFGDWELVKVVKSFTYLPSFVGDAARDPNHAAFRKPMALKDYLSPEQAEEIALGSLGEDEGKFVAEHCHAPDEVLLIVSNGGEELAVKARNFVLLDQLSNAANIGSIVSGLETSAEVIRFVMDLTTDVVAMLFGGLGAAAKTSAELLTITQSEEFQILVENFQTDPRKLVTEVIETLENKVLQPSFLLEYLLFPKGGPLELLAGLARGTGGAKKPTPGAKRRTSFSGAINALLNLGKHVAGGFESLHERFQGPMAGLRGSVVTRPRLRWSLDMVATYGPMVMTLVATVSRAIDQHPELSHQIANLLTGERDAKSDDKDMRGAAPEGGTLSSLFQDIVADKVDALDDELARVMLTLSELELPEEIVPLNVLVGAIVDLILKLAGRSAKGKLAVLVVKTLPIRDAYVAELTKDLEDKGLDPNRLWSDKLLRELGPKFTEFRDAAVDDLYGVIDKTLAVFRHGLQATTGEQIAAKPFTFDGPRDKIDVKPVAGNYAAAMRDPDTLIPRQAPAVTIPASAGDRLDPGVLAKAETRFGHDLKHVRLHAGREGEEATAPARALGLASGSHIYLHPKVSLSSERGREVLDHELTHVLQQTGARPLGEDADPRPRRGAPHKGMTYNQRDETEARRTAKAVKRGAAKKPVKVTPKPEEEGLSPSLGDMVAFQLLDLIASTEGVQNFSGDIDRLAALKRKDDPDRIQAMAKALWPLILGKLDEKVAFEATFTSQKDAIRAYLQSHSTSIEAAIPVIVEKTWLTSKPKKTEPGQPKPKPAHQFRASAFAATLSSYVFARTGVAMAITLDQSAADKTKASVGKVRVHYLNLGRVPPGHSLWTTLKWTPGVTPPLRSELAARMAVLDAIPGVWDADEYRLSTTFQGDFAKRAGKRPKAKLPTKADYLAVNRKDSEGLRFGSHGELTGRAKGPFGEWRESHHTTQFLLAEYFRNERKAQQPFRSGVSYPGVKRASLTGAVDKIGDIEVASTAGKDRGDAMPAIFLAKETHREGRLHVNREAKWIESEEKTGSTSQGWAIDNKFRANLPSWLNRLEGNQSELSKLTANRSNTEVAKEIQGAALATYRWMYDEVMAPALRKSLPRNELAFYRGLAAREPGNLADSSKGVLKAAYDLSVGDLLHVATQAEQRNRTEMSKLKWVL